MSKKGSKDWFGNAVRNFDKINRRNGNKDDNNKVQTLEEQIAIAEKAVEKDVARKKEEKEKEKNKVRWHRSSIHFTRNQ